MIIRFVLFAGAVAALSITGPVAAQDSAGGIVPKFVKVLNGATKPLGIAVEVGIDSGEQNSSPPPEKPGNTPPIEG